MRRAADCEFSDHCPRWHEHNEALFQKIKAQAEEMK